MRLSRHVGSGNGPVLSVVYEKTNPGGSLFRAEGTLECDSSPLCTPAKWSFTSDILDKNGKAFPSSHVAKTAARKDGAVVFGKNGRRMPISGAYTLNWALFDAVQRLPREPFEPLRFTLIDHFDQVKTDYALSFRETTEVLLGAKNVQRTNWVQLEKGRVRRTRWVEEGGEPVTLHAYGLIGRGNLPRVYWTDDTGRPLFAVAGIEAYILEPAATANAQGSRAL
jgi:hypothetical protein